MKIKTSNSILSCILKCIRFVQIVINKNIIFGLLIFGLLGACTAPTAMLGPAYTLTSSGNIIQAGFSYGSGELVRNYTGKTPMENLQKISSEGLNKKQNIQKKTLESEDFYNLVKKKIDKTSSILKLSTQ
jgi:hypothetical protein